MDKVSMTACGVSGVEEGRFIEGAVFSAQYGIISQPLHRSVVRDHMYYLLNLMFGILGYPLILEDLIMNDSKLACSLMISKYSDYARCATNAVLVPESILPPSKAT